MEELHILINVLKFDIERLTEKEKEPALFESYSEIRPVQFNLKRKKENVLSLIKKRFFIILRKEN